MIKIIKLFVVKTYQKYLNEVNENTKKHHQELRLEVVFSSETNRMIITEVGNGNHVMIHDTHVTNLTSRVNTTRSFIGLFYVWMKTVFSVRLVPDDIHVYIGLYIFPAKSHNGFVHYNSNYGARRYRLVVFKWRVTNGETSRG